jgi:hypothetical protein
MTLSYHVAAKKVNAYELRRRNFSVCGFSLDLDGQLDGDVHKQFCFSFEFTERLDRRFEGDFSAVDFNTLQSPFRTAFRIRLLLHEP